MQTLPSNHDRVEAGGRRPWQQPAIIVERPLFADAQGGPEWIDPGAPVFSPMSTSVFDCS